MNISLVLSPSTLSRLELLSRYKGVSVSQLAHELIEEGLRAAVSALPPRVVDAIETIISGAGNMAMPPDNANGVLVEYEAARLRFLKKKIEPLQPRDRLRIKVPGVG